MENAVENLGINPQLVLDPAPDLGGVGGGTKDLAAYGSDSKIAPEGSKEGGAGGNHAPTPEQAYLLERLWTISPYADCLTFGAVVLFNKKYTTRVVAGVLRRLPSLLLERRLTELPPILNLFAYTETMCREAG